MADDWGQDDQVVGDNWGQGDKEIAQPSAAPPPRNDTEAANQAFLANNQGSGWSTGADIAKTIPSGLARGASGAIGLPGEIGHGMRYLTDLARQKLGYPANPDYVAGTGKFAQALALSPEQKDVQSFIERGTGPLYEPKTTAGRYANAAAEIAGGSAIPFGEASRAADLLHGASGYTAELGPYFRNWLTSSAGAGTASEGAGEAAQAYGAPPAVQAGLQAAAGLAGGYLAPNAVNAALAKGPPSQETVDRTIAALSAFYEGVPVPKAAVAGSLAKPVAGRFASLPIVGTPLREASQKSLDELGNRVQSIANVYGSGDRATSGGNLRDAIVDYIENRSRAPINALYNKVDNLVDDTAVQPLSNTQALKNNLLKTQSATVRNVNEAALSPIMEDLEGPGLTYSGIKQLRTTVGSMLEDNLLPSAGTTKPVLDKIYGALTKDLEAAIDNAGQPGALTAFKEANDAHAAAQTVREDLQRIVGKTGENPGENVFETMVQMARDTGKSANIERLKLARQAVPTDTWDDFTSAFVRRMGANPKTEDFSPDRFLTTYGNLSPEGKRLLFGSTPKGKALSQSLRRLSLINRQFSDFYKLGNPSGTGGANFVTSLFGAGSIPGAIFAPAATASAFGGAFGMWGFSKYMARPANIDKMSNALYARLANMRTPNTANEQRAATATSSLMESLKPYLQQQAPEEEQAGEGQNHAQGGAVSGRLSKALRARGLSEAQIAELFHRGLSGEAPADLAEAYKLPPALIRRLIKAHRADGGAVNEPELETIDPAPLVPKSITDMLPDLDRNVAGVPFRGGTLDPFEGKSPKSWETALYGMPYLGFAKMAEQLPSVAKTLERTEEGMRLPGIAQDLYSKIGLVARDVPQALENGFMPSKDRAQQEIYGDRLLNEERYKRDPEGFMKKVHEVVDGWNPQNGAQKLAKDQYYLRLPVQAIDRLYPPPSLDDGQP